MKHPLVLLLLVVMVTMGISQDGLSCDCRKHKCCKGRYIRDCEVADKTYLDCLDAKGKGQSQSGVYTVQPDKSTVPFKVYCDMVTDGGGWAVFQRRQDGSVDFYRSWFEYVNGFGKLDEEHWLGLENILKFANTQKPAELRVDMTDDKNQKLFAKYSQFSIGNANSKYRLSVGTYSGNAGNALEKHNGHRFSTKDNDAGGAVTWRGAWWYHNGHHHCNLNGLYNVKGNQGVVWWRFKTPAGWHYLKFTEMKVRRSSIAATYLDCLDAKGKGQTKSGVYTIQPDKSSAPFKVYCDMVTDGGGWTVFQRRQDGSVDFYRTWSEYVNGFGEPQKEHWLGLEKLLKLANTQRPVVLRVDMTDDKNQKLYAKYSKFSIGNANSKYKLSVGTYSGNAGNALEKHNGHRFSTKDNDAGGAVTWRGAWWYHNGHHHCNLNGLYNVKGNQGVVWWRFKTPAGWHYLKFTEMKVRRN